MAHHDITLIELLAAARPQSDAARGLGESHARLLHPERPGPASLLERRAVAGFVAALHDEDRARAHFLGLLRATAPDGNPVAAVVEALADAASDADPYGDLPLPGAQGGAPWRIAPAAATVLGPRLVAALEHAHLLALRPGAVDSAALAALLRAGWTAPGIVVLTQIVSLVGFQLRIAAGQGAVMAWDAPFAFAAE